MPGMSDYAQIPTNLICRFGELSKTEIRVVCFLYASRNRKTGQCNPSYGAIGRAVGVAKTHIGQAIKTLDSNGWICVMADGNIRLLNDPDKVTKTVTPKVTKSVTPEVTETVTEGLPNPSPKVTKSVTKGYEIGNSHIKESSEQKKEQKKEQRMTAKPSRPDYQLLLDHHASRLGKVFDYAAQGKAINTLLDNFSSADCIAYYNYQVLQLTSNGGWRDSVSWLTVQKTIAEWVAGGKPLEPIEKNGSYKNGNRKRTDADVLRESEEFYRNYSG